MACEVTNASILRPSAPGLHCEGMEVLWSVAGALSPPKKKKYEKQKNMCFPDSCGRKMICKKECKKRKAFLFRKNGSELVDSS